MSGVIDTALASAPLSLDKVEKLLCQLIFHNEKEDIEYYPVQLIHNKDSPDCSAVLVFQATRDVCNNLSNIANHKTYSEYDNETEDYQGDESYEAMFSTEEKKGKDQKEGNDGDAKVKEGSKSEKGGDEDDKSVVEKKKPTLKKVNKFKDPDFGKKKSKPDNKLEWQKKGKVNKFKQAEEELKQRKESEKMDKDDDKEDITIDQLEDNVPIQTTSESKDKDQSNIAGEETEKQNAEREGLADAGQSKIKEEDSKSDEGEGKNAGEKKKPALKKVNKFKELDFAKKKGKPNMDLEWQKKGKGKLNKFKQSKEDLKQEKEKSISSEKVINDNQEKADNAKVNDVARDDTNKENMELRENDLSQTEDNVTHSENVEIYGMAVGNNDDKKTEESTESSKAQEESADTNDHIVYHGWNMSTDESAINVDTNDNLGHEQQEIETERHDENVDSNIYDDDEEIKKEISSKNDSVNADDHCVTTAMYMLSSQQEHELSILSNEMVEATYEGNVAYDPEKDAFDRNVKDAYRDICGGEDIDLLSLNMLHEMSAEYSDIPEKVKFQVSNGLLTDAEKNYINQGKTFHARKARRCRLRRWQSEMKDTGLMDIIEAMHDKTRSIMKRQARILMMYI